MRKKYETARTKIVETDEIDAVRCSGPSQYGPVPYTLDDTAEVIDGYDSKWLSTL